MTPERHALIAYQWREQRSPDEYFEGLVSDLAPSERWAAYRELADAYMDMAMERLRDEGGLCEHCGKVLERDRRNGRRPKRWCSMSCRRRDERGRTGARVDSDERRAA